MKTVRWNNIQFRTVFTTTRLRTKPTELYERRVNDGELINDDHQRRIVKQLDGVYESLIGYSPPSRNKLLKLFRPLKTSPNGLYMHGSVGCGKTMLMDLFFSCCEVSAAGLYVVVFIFILCYWMFPVAALRGFL